MLHKITIIGCGCGETQFKRKEYIVDTPDKSAAMEIAQQAKNNLLMKGQRVKRVKVEAI